VYHTESFKREVLEVSHTKVANCFISSDASVSFDEAFVRFAPSRFKNFYYCCTGSLAVEAALKTALECNKRSNPRIITFRNSFHGINGWASFVTSREDPIAKRVEGYPQNYILECDEDFDSFVDNCLRNNIAAVLVEPIRSSYGDVYFDKKFLKKVCDWCNNKGITLIFDEIQTGMGATGTYWYYEQLGVNPDIVVFGKRSQLAGIMVTERVSDIFKQKEKKLEATWDATLIDMIRCKHIIKAYEDLDILTNVRERSAQLKSGLDNPRIRYFRSSGLIAAFDLKDEFQRNDFSDYCYGNGLLVNVGGKTTIRLRPSLAVSYNEMQEALQVINDYGA
jgi:L-lysine 6-transaminase